MISPKLKEDLELLGKSGFAKTLKEYIEEELKEVCDIDVPESWDETLAAKKHKKFLMKLLSLIEPAQKTPVDKKRDQYR